MLLVYSLVAEIAITSASQSGLSTSPLCGLRPHKGEVEGARTPRAPAQGFVLCTPTATKTCNSLGKTLSCISLSLHFIPFSDFRSKEKQYEPRSEDEAVSVILFVDRFQLVSFQKVVPFSIIQIVYQNLKY